MQQSLKQMLDLHVNLNFFPPKPVSLWVNSLFYFLPTLSCSVSFSINFMAFLQFSLHINDYNTFREISQHEYNCEETFRLEEIKQLYLM